MGFFRTSLGPGSTMWVKGQQKIGEGKKKINKLGDVSPCFFVSPWPLPLPLVPGYFRTKGFHKPTTSCFVTLWIQPPQVAFPHQQLAMRGNWFYRLQLWVPEFLWVHQPQIAGNWAKGFSSLLLPHFLHYSTCHTCYCLSQSVNPLRWCYTGWLATTIYSATQRCNIIGTLVWMVATLFQHCNAVLR